MKREALPLNLQEIAEAFDEALRSAGFSYERPSLQVALTAYPTWLQTPVRSLKWGESDRAAVGMEPIPDGAFVIDLERYLGEEAEDSSVALHLVFSLDRTPGLHDYTGASVEAFDEARRVWVDREVRTNPVVAAALAGDPPVTAELRINGFLIR